MHAGNGQLHQFDKVCQFFCVNDQALFVGMGARGKGQRLFPRLSM